MADDREPATLLRPATLLGGLLAGAAIAGAVLWCLRLFRAGDEPPIRVKGGSLHLDLHKGGTWQRLGGSGKWRISTGQRSREEYCVSISGSGKGCSVPCGRRVKITYTDGARVDVVEIKAPGLNTMVESTRALTLASGGTRLTLPGSGFISRIEVDGHVCDFAQGEFDEAELTEP